MRKSAKLNHVLDTAGPRVTEFFREFVTYLVPGIQVGDLSTAREIYDAAIQAFDNAGPEGLDAIARRLELFKRYQEEREAETDEKPGEDQEDLDEREVLRLAYINICRNLAGPLQMFLDHPFTPKVYADKISEIFADL